MDNDCFATRLRQELSDEYRDKTFTYLDLFPIAKEHGAKSSDIGVALRYLEKRSLIYIDGEIVRPKGGTPTKIYKIVEGAELVRLPRRKGGDIVITPQEVFLGQCFKRLEYWIDGVTRKSQFNGLRA